MKAFLRHFGAVVLGVLCGFDRIRFKGIKRKLAYPDGIARFCYGNQIQYKSFVSHAKDITSTLTHALETPAKEAGIYRYLTSSLVLPGDVALEMAGLHPKPGLIAVLGRVEPCQIIVMRGKKGLLEPRIEVGKCLHYYHYSSTKRTRRRLAAEISEKTRNPWHFRESDKYLKYRSPEAWRDFE